jgi:hypothetical protein
MKFSIYQPAKNIRSLKTNRYIQMAQHPRAVLRNQTHTGRHVSTSNLLEQVMSSLAWNG